MKTGQAQINFRLPKTDPLAKSQFSEPFLDRAEMLQILDIRTHMYIFCLSTLNADLKQYSNLEMNTQWKYHKGE